MSDDDEQAYPFPDVDAEEVREQIEQSDETD